MSQLSCSLPAITSMSASRTPDRSAWSGAVIQASDQPASVRFTGRRPPSIKLSEIAVRTERIERSSLRRTYLAMVLPSPAQASQFSTLRPRTRSNSSVLAVTTMASVEQAWAAISRSLPPMGRPAASSLDRMPPYSESAGTSNGSTVSSPSTASTALINCFEPLFAQLSCDDDTRADFVLADLGDPLRRLALRILDQVGNDIRVEQIKRQNTRSGAGSSISGKS
jgi:hypothetical protein